MMTRKAPLGPYSVNELAQVRPKDSCYKVTDDNIDQAHAHGNVMHKFMTQAEKPLQETPFPNVDRLLSWNYLYNDACYCRVCSTLRDMQDIDTYASTDKTRGNDVLGRYRHFFTKGAKPTIMPQISAFSPADRSLKAIAPAEPKGPFEDPEELGPFSGRINSKFKLTKKDTEDKDNFEATALDDSHEASDADTEECDGTDGTTQVPSSEQIDKSYLKSVDA